MTIGNDAVIEAMISGESCLVLLAEDASQRTAKDIVETAQKNNIQIVRLSYDKQQISRALGKLTAVISINEAGFAKKIIELTGNE